MAELTQKMVQERLNQVASGTYTPHIPGLPGIFFVKMGLQEKGVSSRAYSKRLKELYQEGGYFSEAMLPTVLEKVAKENGLDIGVLKKRQEIQKKFYEGIPEELSKPYDPLTEEEAVLLSPEEQAERAKAIEEHGRKIMDFLNNAYSEEEQRVFEQARQIEQLEQQLKSNTAESYAKEYQMQIEILHCTRKADNTEERYFESIEDIATLEETNRQALIQLYTKWKAFREGMNPDFFYQSS